MYADSKVKIWFGDKCCIKYNFDFFQCMYNVMKLEKKRKKKMFFFFVKWWRTCVSKINLKTTKLTKQQKQLTKNY